MVHYEGLGQHSLFIRGMRTWVSHLPMGIQQTLEGPIRGALAGLLGGAAWGEVNAVCSLAGFPCLVIVDFQGAGGRRPGVVLAKERTLLCPHDCDLFLG